MDKQHYLVEGRIGYSWDGPRIDIGVFRWKWYAFLRGWLWMQSWPYSSVYIKELNV